MISSLHGTVLSATGDQVVIEVGGVGFAVAVPGSGALTARPGEKLRLHTHLGVREDALSLYGFAEAEELEVFALLLTVTGVGPKSALGVIGQLSVDQIAAAVAGEDDAPFRRVSGIGPKTAKLIVMQLTGKIAAPAKTTAGGVTAAGVVAQVTAALVGLGWSEKVAAEAAAQTADSASAAEKEAVSGLLRRTLAALGPAAAGAPCG